MELARYLTPVHEQLVAAAALGDDHTREIAATLSTAAIPAVRLAILTALSAAADEITAALLDHPGSPGVTVRLAGDEVQVVVQVAAENLATDARTDDGDTSARISLRLGESLKSDIDGAAARDGVSVNTWLVRAAANALPARGGRTNAKQHRVTGWING